MKIDWLKKIECSFTEIKGVVIDATHTTKTTHKTQYVPTGALSGVNIKTPEVHTVNTDHNKFWIETPTGEQVHLQHRNLSYPPLVGQSVVELRLKVKQDQFEDEWIVALINKTANKVDYFGNPLTTIKKGFSVNSKMGLYGLYALCLCFFIIFIPPIAMYFVYQHHKNKDQNIAAQLAIDDLTPKIKARCQEILTREIRGSI